MDILSCHIHTFFDSKVLELLGKKQIFTVLDFLSSDPKLIEKGTNSTFREILEVRKQLLKKYSARPENAFDYYQYILHHCAIIQTGVKNLDQLLEGGLFTSNIYEICGLPSSGKTLFCLTLLKNVALSMTNTRIYYLDTKFDFRAKKMKHMLNHLGKEKVVEVMNNIMVSRIQTKQELLDTLIELRELVQNGSNIKLVIIDSLPPLYLQSCDPTESNSFLNYMVNILRYLVVKGNIVIIVTNLLTLWNDGDFKNKNVMKERIACGSYWYNVPNVRLKFNKEADKCTITVMKSRRIMPKLCQCQVDITDMGLI
ncbi:hypothetical protein JTB14_018448 [Gonioctena quinquepunctata]|nr:hypothetical protein JTB14_018448 [Gonioctena quinquepunctata]